MNRTLAESQSYKVVSEFENVVLIRKKGFVRDEFELATVGDFYGDPKGALIAWDESFVVSFGYGFILYWISGSFEPYGYDTETPQWVEHGRSPSNIWEINHFEQHSANILLFSATQEENTATYKLILPDFLIEKLG